VIGFSSDDPGAAAHPGNPCLILDGGTGLIALQRTLMEGSCGQGVGELPVVLSHYHWDHLIGIPFFDPIFIQGNRLTFYSASVEALRTSIERLFTSVSSPLKTVQNLAADVAYCQLDPNGTLVSDFEVLVVPNLHPGGSHSYRLQYGAHAIVYTTDHEAGDPQVDRRLIELARGAQLWILDAFFTAQERPDHNGWGHSSYLEAVEFALAAGVETAVLFHHHPRHADAVLDRMGLEASELAAGTSTQVLMARDGMVVDVGRVLRG
jgi:phosphoribosyl 1,2-cyclic phosphodiesterase